MCDVARIAVERGYSQEKLASLYNEVATHRARTKRGANGGTISRHFLTKRLTKQVVENYAKALGMRDRYVQLLIDRSALKPTKAPGLGAGDAIERFLMPTAVEPLFESGAITDTVRFLRADEKRKWRLLGEAVLAFEQARMGIRRFRLVVPKEAAFAAGVGEEYLIKWSIIAAYVEPEVRLAHRISIKTADLILREELLAHVWRLLCMGFAFNKETDGQSATFPMLTWSEWCAVESLLKTMYEHRGWPAKQMVQRLHKQPLWGDFLEQAGAPDYDD